MNEGDSSLPFKRTRSKQLFPPVTETAFLGRVELESSRPAEPLLPGEAHSDSRDKPMPVLICTYDVYVSNDTSTLKSRFLTKNLKARLT